MQHSFGGIFIQNFLETIFDTVFGASFIVCLGIMTYHCVKVNQFPLRARGAQRLPGS